MRHSLPGHPELTQITCITIYNFIHIKVCKVRTIGFFENLTVGTSSINTLLIDFTINPIRDLEHWN